jgi:hypothetical protein
MSHEIERAIDFFVRRRRAQRDRPQIAVEGLSPGAFRAVVDERLRSLERQLDELKGRINGLLFLLAGAVATQVVLRLFV